MADATPQAATVLIVEDERDLANLFGEWLRSSYGVQTASDGEEALDQLDESIDVVLLDRRMPGLSGDEVLETIRDRDLDIRVAIVTAVNPDFDLVEMGFDAYVLKPVSGDELHEVVETMLTRATYDRQVRKFYQLIETKAALEAEKPVVELASSQTYAELEDRLARLRDELEATLEEFDEADFEAAFRSFSRNLE